MPSSLTPTDGCTFAVSVRTSQDRALLDDSVGFEEAVNVLLGLLFVQHPDEQLPVFWNKEKPQTERKAFVKTDPN